MSFFLLSDMLLVQPPRHPDAARCSRGLRVRRRAARSSECMCWSNADERVRDEFGLADDVRTGQLMRLAPTLCEVEELGEPRSPCTLSSF